jgi:hypothetical protein
MRDRFLCSIRLRAAARVLALVPLTAAAILLASAEPTLPVMERIYPLAPQEGVFAYARISPDGNMLVYASETRRAIGSAVVDRTVTIVDVRTRKVFFTELGVDGYWSNDGRRMIFLSEKDGLARVSIRYLDGTIVRDVAPVPLGGYFSWGNRNGRDLVLTISGNFYYLAGDRALPSERVPSCEGIGDAARPLLSKDGRRITTFLHGTIVVRNLTDCVDVFDTGVQGAKADFSWDGRYIAFHAPKASGTGYEIEVIDLEHRTIRTITDLPGSSFFPSWTEDGRLAFRYDGDEYRGFMMASDVLSAPERPLGQASRRVPDRIGWTDVFPETPTPSRRLAVVTVWGTWSAHSPEALIDLQRASRELAKEGTDVTVLTATDYGSRSSDVRRIRTRYRITLREIPLAASRLPLTDAQNQIPVTLLFRDGVLLDRRLGAQPVDALRSWVNAAAAPRASNR